ncbi:MAG: hypothetical protein HY055_03835 [Magnetospirillum sp.]|nr:hypothetical protein [Magnetospirillum sp.]
MSAYNNLEQEVIILEAVWGMIDDMVNREMFVLGERTSDTNLLPTTSTHQRLFNVLLVDFLSRPHSRGKEPMPFGLPMPPAKAKGSQQSYLFYLNKIHTAPKLGAISGMICEPVDAFSQWLDTKAQVKKVWLPSIGLELDIDVKRIDFLKICGNIAKHNFSRLESDVSKICNILAENGLPIEAGNGYLILKEFYAWFHDDILNYHISTIAEFLNNIRWGIYEYLRNEFDHAFEWVDPHPMYRFRIPGGLVQPVAQSMYRDLMNRMRSEPSLPRFTAIECLKKRY